MAESSDDTYAALDAFAFSSDAEEQATPDRTAKDNESLPSSTTNDESNLAEIGRKLSRSFSNLCENNSANLNSAVECVDMKETSGENENENENENEENGIVDMPQFSCSL